MANVGLDVYGPFLARYEGCGTLFTKYGSQAPVEIEATQSSAGEVVVSINTSSRLPNKGNEIGSIHGQSKDGSKFETRGEHFILSFSEQMRDGNGLLTEVHLHAQELYVSRPFVVGEVARVRFALANFVSGRTSTSGGRTVATYEIGDYAIEVKLLDDYWERYQYISRRLSVAQTAWCTVSRIDDRPVELPSVRALVSELVVPLSLAVSAQVDWLYAEALSANGEPIRLEHSSCHVAPFNYSGFTWDYFGELERLVCQWFDGEGTVREDSSLLSRFITHYLDACSEHTYPQRKGLAAATLLDILSGYHAHRKGESLVITEKQWTEIWHTLRIEIEETLMKLNGLQIHSRKEIANNMQSAHRRSFRKRLQAVFEHCRLDDCYDIGEFSKLGIKNSRQVINDLVMLRNRLVHYGAFNSSVEGKNQDTRADYLKLLWACRCLLMRMIWPTCPKELLPRLAWMIEGT